LVVLGDNFFYPTSFLTDIINFHKKNNSDATIGVAEVEDPTRHGMIKIGKENSIVDIIEKPSVKNTPSNLGCIGIYIFNKNIFNSIRKTKPGYNNEYQLTDSIKILIEEGKKVLYKKIKGKHIDVGTIKDLNKVNKFLSG
jgi:dTDP-glucose pyrophosphorylase